MSTTSFEIVVAIRPPYQDVNPTRLEPPEVAALLGEQLPPPTSFWLETSDGVRLPLQIDQFTRASRAYQSGHRRFKIRWSQDGNARRLELLEPANISWGPSMPNAISTSGPRGAADTPDP